MGGRQMLLGGVGGVSHPIVSGIHVCKPHIYLDRYLTPSLPAMQGLHGVFWILRLLTASKSFNLTLVYYVLVVSRVVVVNREPHNGGFGGGVHLSRAVTVTVA